MKNFNNFIKKVKSYWKQLTARWRAKMPRVFKRVMYIGTGISGLAIAVHTALVMAGALEPQWWVTSYPYVVGIPAGAAFMAKFTREQPVENDIPKNIQDDDNITSNVPPISLTNVPGVSLLNVPPVSLTNVPEK